MVVSYVSNVPSIFKALFEMIKECMFWNMGERDMFYFRGERNNFKDPGAASLSDVGALAHGELDSGNLILLPVPLPPAQRRRASSSPAVISSPPCRRTCELQLVLHAVGSRVPRDRKR